MKLYVIHKFVYTASNCSKANSKYPLRSIIEKVSRKREEEKEREKYRKRKEGSFSQKLPQTLYIVLIQNLCNVGQIYRFQSFSEVETLLLFMV